jgi:NDP-sugar pyrophosphorylase family protein
MKAVILAGGLGSRLKPFTEVIPKPLLPIGEKSVLEIQIERFKRYGIRDIYLATNYKSEYIENFFGDGSRYGVRLTISREDKPLGTAGPLTLLKKELKEPFIVMNGDVLSLINFVDFFEFASKMRTMLCLTVKKIITPYSFGNIYFEGDFVTRIEEKPDMVTYALAGIYFMEPEIFEFIPENEYYGLDSLIKSLLKNNVSVSKYELLDYWLDIGRVEDFQKAAEIYQTHFKYKDSE